VPRPRPRFRAAKHEFAGRGWRPLTFFTRDTRAVADSPLEGDGFELLVRGTKAVDFRSIPGIAEVSAGLLNDTT
jgi:hypothetical protein